MSTVYIIMAYGGLVLAALCLVAAVVLFITWDIPKVIGEMTGRTQRRAIAKIQENRQKDMQSHDQEIQTETNSGKIKARMSESMELKKTRERNSGVPDDPLTGVLQGEERTTFLHAAATDEDVTDVLTSNGNPRNTGQGRDTDGEEVTSILHASSMEQTPIRDQAAGSGDEKTTVLTTGNNREIIAIPDEVVQESGKIVQILELIVVHTEEMVG